MSKEQSELEIIENFIYNDDVQDKLREIANALKIYNIFDIVGMGEQEIKHSNFLGWLFELKVDGHGYVFLEDFLRECLTEHQDDPLKEYIYLKSKNTIKTYREWRNPKVNNRPIDLIVEDHDNKVLIVIENKINAGEDTDSEGNNGQLADYKDAIDKYQKWDKLDKYFYFLSPDGMLASEKNRDTWKAIDYSVVATPLEKMMRSIKNNKISINQDFVLLIEHYLDLLYKKGIVMSEKLKENCKHIWANHKQALKILIENAPFHFDDFLQKLKNNEDILDIIPYKQNTKSTYYFITKHMGSINKQNLRQQDLRFYFYFSKSCIQICLNTNQNLPEETQELAKKIIKLQEGKTFKPNNEYALLDTRSSELKHLQYDGYNFEDISEDLFKYFSEKIKEIDECFKNNPLGSK